MNKKTNITPVRFSPNDVVAVTLSGACHPAQWVELYDVDTAAAIDGGPTNTNLIGPIFKWDVDDITIISEADDIPDGSVVAMIINPGVETYDTETPLVSSDWDTLGFGDPIYVDTNGYLTTSADGTTEVGIFLEYDGTGIRYLKTV